MTVSLPSYHDLCMRGRIYSDQKCPLCGGTYQHDDRRRGLYCKNHPDQQAIKRFTVKFGRKIQKRFNNFQSAERFLDGLRYEVDKGTFDYRDYLSSNPLSFTNLSDKYLQKKTKTVSSGTYSHYRRYISVAQEYFQHTNVKQIQYAQLEDFSHTLQVSDKTKACYLECLRTFFKWLIKRKEISKIDEPEFPKISYELGYRKTISKEVQGQILEELKNISYHVSPKIWIGVKWLITYISIRPNELRNIKEGHIDLKQGFVLIPHPKEKKPKIIPLIQEDIDLLKNYPTGLPDLYFFRHGKNVSGVTPGQRFGKNTFYKWWKKSCENLDIQGVDLYGGTRHSSAIGLRKKYSPEQIKLATMHSTNKAFERYFKIPMDSLEEMYNSAKCTTDVQPKKKGSAS